MGLEEPRRDGSREQDLGFLFEHLPGVAFIKNREGRYLFALGDFPGLPPRSAHAMIGRADEEIWPAALAARFKETDASVIRTNAPVQTIETLDSTVGRHDWLVYKFPVAAGNGRFIGGFALRYCRAATEPGHAPAGSVEDRLAAAREEERKRLAFRLHDELGHDLLLLKLRLASLGDRMKESGGGLPEEYASLLLFTDGVIENFRRVSQDLSPVLLEKLGLSSSLEYILDEHCRLHNVESRISNVEAIDVLFPLPSQIHIYRIFQEALANIGRHARATCIAVEIARERDRVTFRIEDDGAGFDPAASPASPTAGRGLGLAAIEERVRLLAGVLAIESTPGQGAAIRFSIPIDDGRSTL